jgi:ATP-binding cassette, subfamily F, member 3
LSEERAFAILRRLLFTSDTMATPIGELSGGEKSRLQIARLMLTEANLLLLDEPTNNLDIPSAEILEAELADFEGTILVVSHDRYFLDKIVDRIVAFEDHGRIVVYPGNFTAYYEARQR